MSEDSKPETILLPVDTYQRLKVFHRKFKGHIYNFRFTHTPIKGGFYEVYRNEATVEIIKNDPYLNKVIGYL